LWLWLFFMSMACIVGVAVLCLCSWCLINLIDKMIVGVGWGNHVIAWLMTYQGVDCQLWSSVHSKCMGSKLCNEVAGIFMNELRKHRCFGHAPK
jgi:hypothetical protein